MAIFFLFNFTKPFSGEFIINYIRMQSRKALTFNVDVIILFKLV